MTVRELINTLLDLPMDGEIFIDAYGEYIELSKKDMRVDKEGDVIIGV